MRTDSFKFCVEGTFPFRDELHSLAGRASSLFNIAKKFPGCEAVRLNSDNLPAEVIGERIAVDGHFFYPSRLKNNNGFFVMRDRLKMHGLAVTGHSFCCHSGLSGIGHSREGGNPEQQDKSICHIGHIRPMLLHKESIS